MVISMHFPFFDRFSYIDYRFLLPLSEKNAICCFSRAKRHKARIFQISPIMIAVFGEQFQSLCVFASNKNIAKLILWMN